MNKQELIKRIEVLPYTEGPIADTITINRNWILESIEQLDEPETGHADEAPRYVKNVLARLRELPLHDREVWLKAIMGEFEQDFSHAKWREGYEQGKVEGMVEREKVIVPQMVAEWIKKCKTFKSFAVSLSFALEPNVWEVNGLSHDCIEWLADAENQETFARAWLDGYDIQETKYVVTDGNHLYFKNYQEDISYWLMNNLVRWSMSKNSIQRKKPKKLQIFLVGKCRRWSDDYQELQI